MVDTIEIAIKSFLQSRNLQMKEVAPSVRVALTGKCTTSRVVAIVEVLGKNASTQRRENAARLAEKTP